MPDKKYHELAKRLEKNKNSKGNFRTYETGRNNSAIQNQKERSGNEGETPRPVKKPQKARVNFAFPENLTRVIVIALVAVVALVMIIYSLTYKNATEVAVDGEAVGQLKTVNITMNEFVDTLIKKIEQLEETKIRIKNEITLTPVHGSSKQIKDDSQLLNLMSDTVEYQVLAAEIRVDGQLIGIAKNQAEAKAILDMMMAPYIKDPENTTARFVQDVKAVDTFVEKTSITPSDTIRAELSKTSTVNSEYEVVSGDVLSRIAAVNGMTMTDIKDANPGLDVTKPLQIGQKINVISTMPAVSVLTIETTTETVPIKMETIPQKDASLASGENRVLQTGKDGKKEIVTQITKINGVKTSQDNVSEKIIEPAQPQIVAVGG